MYNNFEREKKTSEGEGEATRIEEEKSHLDIIFFFILFFLTKITRQEVIELQFPVVSCFACLLVSLITKSMLPERRCHDDDYLSAYFLAQCSRSVACTWKTRSALLASLIVFLV